MKPITAADPEASSLDVVEQNIERLQALFPEAFTEGKIDFAVLKQLLGGAVEDREEKYGLNWNGKRRARQLALTPSTGTLRPCPEDSVDWDTTQNLMIEGDNLEVLKLLQKSYADKVKLIYIDPPYNTGNDFVYPDDYRDSIRNYLELTGQVDGAGRRLTSNTEASGRFYTDWLNMMYPRLRVARDLLRDDGLPVISIDNNEIDRLKGACAEVFGEENFLAQISVQSNPRGRQSDTFFATVHEYLLLYAGNIQECSVGGADLTDEQRSEFSGRDLNNRAFRLLGLRQRGSASRREDRPDMFFPIYVNPNALTVSLTPETGFTAKVLPRKSTGEDGRWMWGKIKCQKDIHLLVPRLIDRRGEYDIFVTDYLDRGGEERSRKFKTIWEDRKLNTQNGTQEVKDILGCAAFSFPKPLALLRDIVQFGAQDGDIVLDFFAGSGTTGHAVMIQNASDSGNRRFIVVQLPEMVNPDITEQKIAADCCDRLSIPRTIAELTKERLRRAGQKVRQENPMFPGDIGFRVFKLDSSNIRAWDPDRDALAQTLLDSVEHLKPGRSEDDILFEVLLKLGLELTTPIELQSIAGKNVHCVGAGTLFACLAEQISRDEAEPLALGIVEWHKALNPAGESMMVFRDSAFADDVVKANIAAILQQHGLANVRSL